MGVVLVEREETGEVRGWPAHIGSHIQHGVGPADVLPSLAPSVVFISISMNETSENGRAKKTLSKLLTIEVDPRDISQTRIPATMKLRH
jgi:hypothetical protein